MDEQASVVTFMLILGLAVMLMAMRSCDLMPR
jgi:hypothetical protein